MTDDLVAQLEGAASEQPGKLADLLGAASERIQEQEGRIEELSEEIEETNEGMMALTVELQAAEQRFRSLFEDALEGIYKTTPDCEQYVMANPAMASILGYDSPEALCESVTDIGADVFVDPDRYEEYHRRLQNGQDIEDFEYRIERPDGEVRWVADNVRSVEAYGDDPPGYRGGLVDITDRKAYEDQLEQLTEKLSTLNQVVRHDIRNDMQIIGIWAEMLADELDREAVEKIREHTEHVIDLTTVAGEYAETLTGDDSVELEPVSLSRILRREVEKQQSSQKDATIWVAGTIPNVTVEANAILGSVFRNLFTNAISHNDTDAPLVEVRCAVDEETVTVSVADNGPGVPGHLKETIFAKGEQGLDSEGTGIGLALVSNLTQSYGGDVRVGDRETWEALPEAVARDHPTDPTEPGGAVFSVDLRRLD